MHTIKTTAKSFLTLISLLSLMSLTSLAEERPIVRPTITVIIDDIGDNQRLGLRAARLPSKVALSILPHTPFSKEVATYGHDRGQDILLHQPMESYKDKHLLGPGALFKKMGRQEFSLILENNISAVPYVVGINNHMGSLLTKDAEKMGWLMAELRPRELFFIDSRTTSKSIAAKTADLWQIPNMTRRIFLDHTDDKVEINKQFQKLLRLAKKHGHATAIGHPRINTLEYLEQMLPKLQNAGVEIISATEVMDHHQYASRSKHIKMDGHSISGYPCYLAGNKQEFEAVLQGIVANYNCDFVR